MADHTQPKTLGIMIEYQGVTIIHTPAPHGR